MKRALQFKSSMFMLSLFSTFVEHIRWWASHHFRTHTHYNEDFHYDGLWTCHRMCGKSSRNLPFFLPTYHFCKKQKFESNYFFIFRQNEYDYSSITTSQVDKKKKLFQCENVNISTSWRNEIQFKTKVKAVNMQNKRQIKCKMLRYVCNSFHVRLIQTLTSEKASIWIHTQQAFVHHVADGTNCWISFAEGKI